MKKFILTLLALCILPSHANALSCVAPDFNRSLEGAQTVFEGRLTKIETIFGKEHLNKLTAIVETPYKGAEKGEEITIYQKHWMHSNKPWEETETDKKEGIFMLNKRNSADTNLGFWFDKDIYFVGMCSSAYWTTTDEYKDILESEFTK